MSDVTTGEPFQKSSVHRGPVIWGKYEITPFSHYSEICVHEWFWRCEYMINTFSFPNLYKDCNVVFCQGYVNVLWVFHQVFHMKMFHWAHGANFQDTETQQRNIKFLSDSLNE